MENKKTMAFGVTDIFWNIACSAYLGKTREFMRNGINDGTIDSVLFTRFIRIGASKIFVRTI